MKEITFCFCISEVYELNGPCNNIFCLQSNEMNNLTVESTEMKI